MEKFKIDHFKNSYPGKEFPWYKHVPEKECEAIKKQLYQFFEVSKDKDGFGLIKAILKTVEPIKKFNAEDDNFNLIKTFDYLSINPNERVYINWYHFDDIDLISVKDLAEYFDDIWYPGPDDITIFDSSLSWMIFVDHSGYLSYTKVNL